MPCFGALLAQIQAKVKFLQILYCHFLGVRRKLIKNSYEKFRTV